MPEPWPTLIARLEGCRTCHDGGLLHTGARPLFCKSRGERSGRPEMTAMIADAGLMSRRIHEPRPTDDEVKRRPKLDNCTRLPYFLVFDCVKVDA